MRADPHWARRCRLAVVAAVAVPAGLALKFGYRGPGHTWAYGYGAGVVYEVFWIALFGLLVPRWTPAGLAVGVFAGTCLLEALQLWHPAWLEALRSTRLGAMGLGSSFDWLDLPHYALGSAMGYGLARWADARVDSSAEPG